MQTRRREITWLALIGLCSIAPVTAGAQLPSGEMGEADGNLRNAPVQRRSESIRRVQTSDGSGGRLITLVLQQATIKDALRAVTKQAEVQLVYNDGDLPADRLVTATISGATVERALGIVLSGTELQMRAVEGGIVIEPQTRRTDSENRVRRGSLSGRVTDAATGRPLAAVAIRLEEADLATTTSAEGVYRFHSVPAGTYALSARQIGYERSTTSVVIVDGEDAEANIALTPAPTVLDQIVTTGTVVPTAVKSLPTPVTVITSDQIAQQHAFTMMAIVRQAVPTAIAHDAPNVPANTDISVRGASSLTGRGDMKIFVDGVESSTAGNTPVDPTSIDRIEVIRGPQAATLYGADAAGGVIQIFTKRGDTSLTRPRVSAHAELGITQTPYTDYEHVLRQQYSASVDGGSSNVNYRFGGSYKHLGDYVPESGRTRQSGSSVYGGMNFSRSGFTADVSGRYYHNTIPSVFNPEEYSAGYVPYSRPYFTRGDFVNETYGARLTGQHAGWWRNELTMGVDRFGLGSTQTQARLTTPQDTLLELLQIARRKLSVGFNTTASGPLGHSIAGSLTLGVDHYSEVESSMSTMRALNSSGAIRTVPNGSLNFSDNTVGNTGYFAQAQVALRDAVFLTVGVRSEDNSAFGRDYGLATLPRVGLSLVRSVGDATLKARASYGKSLRTPGPSQATSWTGPSSIQLANEDLAPERQQGWDGGVDLVFGSSASVSISGFDQTAIDLISLIQVGSTPLPTYQYLNIGRVSNRGVELEGTFTLAPSVALRAQYGHIRSRVTAVGAAGGQVAAGDPPVGVPANTAGATLTLLPHEGTTITAGVTYYGSFRGMNWLTTIRCLATFAAPECPESFLDSFSFREFLVKYPGFAKLNIGLSHRINSRLEASLTIDNLTDAHVFEFDNSTPMVGRTTMFGFGVTY